MSLEDVMSKLLYGVMLEIVEHITWVSSTPPTEYPQVEFESLPREL